MNKAERIFRSAVENRKPLVLDGAMGSNLEAKGKTSEKNWSANANHMFPDTVVSLHKEYVEAGADILTSNTFRTNPAVIQSFEKRQIFDEVKLAVDLIKEVRNDHDFLIAGSNPPAEDCYTRKRTLTLKELERNHALHIDFLMENEVDFILNETQSHSDEIKLITDYCHRHKIPFVISLYSDEHLKLLSGEKVLSILPSIIESEPLALSFNCISLETFKKFKNTVVTDYPGGFYLNCGSSEVESKNLSCTVSPKEYLDEVKPLIDKNTVFIGSCCGSTPEHIKLLRDFVDG